MRFPVHLRANLHYTNLIIESSGPEGKRVHDDGDDGKGPQCGRGSESTPVAARIRSKLET